MYRLAFLLTVVLTLNSCGHSQQKGVRRYFRTEVRLKTTPVKQQGRSQLCWAYGMLATIETNHLMQGDSVNLSPSYVARMLLRDRAVDSYLNEGSAINTRGMMPMLVDIIERYGILPYDSYPDRDDVNLTVLSRKVARAEANAAHRRLGFGAAAREADNLMDQSLGYMPRFVFMLGAQYTPLEFAHSVCLPDEYQAYTSFTHHPFGQPFRLEVPDNQHGSEFMNVPIDTLMDLIVRQLRSGRAVCWEGDISEPGFSFSQGLARLPKGTGTSQQDRQRCFERRQTTDDHVMELMGLARDRRGRLWFIAKNSWGEDNPYGGYMYLRYDYVRLKTIAVMMAKP